MLNKLQNLNQLYSDIHSCTLCHKVTRCNVTFDSLKIKRHVLKESLKSDLFIIAQALAETQVRLSGIPYHSVEGKMSSGGVFLEKYLTQIDYSLDPKNESKKLVYTTDIVQCFPGKNIKGGDNKPTPTEILNCKKWFDMELSLVQPKVLLLLGSSAIKTFYKFYLNTQVDTSEDLYNVTSIYSNYTVFSLPHPTSMVKEKSTL